MDGPYTSEKVFYVKIGSSNMVNGIKTINLHGKAPGIQRATPTWEGPVKYDDFHDPKCQIVLTDDSFTDEGDPGEPYEVHADDDITWELFIIEKVDADKPDLRFEGVVIELTNKSNGTTYTLTTNEYGFAVYLDIPDGTYKLKETSLPKAFGYTKAIEIESIINPIGKLTLKNEKQTGTLRILKEDKTWVINDSEENSSQRTIDDTKYKKLEGIQFKLKKDGKYVRLNDTNEMKGTAKTGGRNIVESMDFVDDVNQGTTLITDENGNIKVNNILIGNYEIEEYNLGDKYYGYTDNDDHAAIDGDYIYYQTGDSTGTNASNFNYTLGTETQLGNEDGKANTIPITIKRQTSTESENVWTYNFTGLTIDNERKYIKIKGYVWEDIRGGKNNEFTYYNEKGEIENEGDKYYKDRDPLVEGISVRLKDRDGNIIKVKDRNGKDTEKTETDSNGSYEFIDVSREAIENDEYYIEFEYDGKKYTTVTTLVGDDSSINSKAGEVVGQRKSLNAAFAEITNKDGNINNRSEGYSRNSNGEITGELTYENHPENWYSKFISTTYDNKTYSNVNLTANTDINTNPEVESSYNLKDEFVAGRYTVGEDGAMVIENVNLGLKRREMPSTSIWNDLTSVKVQVNGYGATYKNDSVGNPYGQRKEVTEKDETTNEYSTNLKAKFGDGSGSYTREIYPSDIQASSNETEDDTKKLKVYAIYTLTIKNNTTGIGISVPEIVNYYDSRYNIVENETDFPEGKLNGVEIVSINGNKTNEILKHKDGDPINGYKTEYITLGSITEAPIIEAGKTLEINVTYQVNEETVLKILSEGDQELSTVAEINGYSMHYSQDAEGCNKDEFYAGIDMKSAPGNATPGVVETYENDTDIAPSFVLTAKGIRQIEGTVFEDTDEEQNDNERKGNGIYDNNDVKRENTIKDVTVTLLNKEDKSSATYYPDAVSEDGLTPDTEILGKTGSTLSLVTGENGYYVFRGVEPGEYLIKYTYTNGHTKICDVEGKELQDITVQKYKSTIINSPIKEAFKANEENDENNKYETWYRDNPEIRNSDARDDYDKRIAIDAEITTIEATTEPTLNSLDAETPYFKIPMEVEPVIVRKADDKDYNAYLHRIENVDFGIIERPRQQVTLEKTVDNIKVTLPAIEGEGTVLINSSPEEQNDNILVARNKEGVIELIQVIMDNELIHGSHLELKYGLKLTNTGELDYVDKDYYYYGTKNENLEPVKITGATIVDYLDKNLVLGNGQNEWKILNMKDKGFDWTLSSNSGEVSDKEKELLNKFSTIVKTEALSNRESLAPKDSKTINITAEKLLTENSQEDKDLIFENKSEVVKVEKTGGSYLYDETPGNYAPRILENKGPLEVDEDDAPTTGIVPPTGLTNHNVLYAIIGIASLIVLGAGTYGVRRFLKK